MTTAVSGRVADETSAGISGLLVVVRDESGLHPHDLGNTTTDGSGQYQVTIPADSLSDVPGPRKLGVYVYTNPGRRELHSQIYDEPASTLLLADLVTLPRANTQGWAVTLGGNGNALPIRTGNALRILIDSEVAWGRLATSIAGAQQSITVMELSFDLPVGGWQSNPAQQRPEIVLQFGSSFTPSAPRAVDPSDTRPETALVAAASGGTQVRVMIPTPDLATFAGIADFVILLVPMLVTALIGFRPAWTFWSGIFNHIFGSGPKGSASAVSKYFTAAGSSAKVLSFSTRTFSVVHAKAVLIDTVGTAGNPEVIVLGSPFEQSYWDTTEHSVYEPRRGSCAGEPLPVHDVSLGIRGPAVADLQEQFKVHWNRDNPGDQVASLAPPAALTTVGDDEYLAGGQLVRTVNESTLPGLPKGELGILEAYQRAIENASEFIYFENQYFTNEKIAQALVDALKDPSRPNLHVILMVNVIPDLPFYPTWQTNLFERIRRDAGAGASRFGVFTAWSHAAPSTQHKRTKPIIMPNYLHTKTAVVDGSWATIGSANLDGASLDQFQILRALQFGNYRNDELNFLIFNGIEGCPATAAVDQLRRQLWGEHLGMDPSDSRLDATALKSSHGWLKLWSDQATAKLQGLISNPATIDPTKGRVLAYPPGAQSGFALLWGWSHPHKDFLQSAKIGGKSVDLTQIDLVEQTTAFSFHDGKWADQ